MDPYQVLGISPNATPEEIARAYEMKLARYQSAGGEEWVIAQLRQAYEQAYEQAVARNIGSRNVEFPIAPPTGDGPGEPAFDTPGRAVLGAVAGAVVGGILGAVITPLVGVEKGSGLIVGLVAGIVAGAVTAVVNKPDPSGANSSRDFR